MDPVLQELNSQRETKRIDAERSFSRFDELVRVDMDAANLELAKGEQLNKDIEAIGKKMADYAAARERERQAREQIERSMASTSTPNRYLPFSAGVSTGRFPEQKGGGGSYEFKTFDGGDIPMSSRSEFKRFGLNTIDPEKKRFVIETGDSVIDKMAGTGGFKSMGHFAWCVTRQGRNGDQDPHSCGMLKNWRDLQLKAPSGMFEESDPDGGDLIPREFSNQVYERLMATNQILPYLQGLPLSGNNLTIPALKEDSRVDGSRHGGVLGYWEGEADQYTKTNPKFRNINLKLHKLTVLTYVTEELLMDSAVALEAYLGRLVPKEINFKINDALINGRGGGMPLGILKANSLITQTTGTGQSSTTIVYQNIVDMWRRAIAGQRSTAIWLYNQDCESALYRLYLSTGTAAGVAVYTPNQLTQFSFMGRPALVMEQCQTLGTAGDIILFCPEGWACILKGGLQSFMSMHLRFDYDEFAYKWRFRMDAQPYDDVALTAFNGSTTYSSAVCLSSTRN